MPLSRLENFLVNTTGNILYVNPSDLDSTDSFDNRGNSLTRPFVSIQRALIEAARFSYQQGLDNDRFGNTTILLYPGEHIVDNRPGWIPIPDGVNAKFRKRDGSESQDFPAWDLDTVYDLNNSNNDEVFVFNGWMFSSSPSITPFDHPVYDIWLVSCY